MMSTWRRSAIACALAGLLLTGCSGTPQLEEPEEKVPTADEVAAVVAEQDYDYQAQLYYLDSGGYIVPVSCGMVFEEGIGKAVLTQLSEESGRGVQLAGMGMKAPIPKGVTVSLDIVDKTAKVDLLYSDGAPADAKAEEGMISCIVNTLLAFDTVEKVTFTYGGEVTETLPKGYALQASYDAPLTNLEPSGTPASATGTMGLYFVDQGGRFLVPVERVVDEQQSNVACMQEMTMPAEDSGLASALPSGCLIRSVTVGENGVATIDLSGDLSEWESSPDLAALGMRALTLTAKELEGVESVAITYQGDPYSPATTTMQSVDDGAINTIG